MVITNDIRTQLVQYLKELHLPTIRENFEEVARCAVQESLSYERYLLELLDSFTNDSREF